MEPDELAEQLTRRIALVRGYRCNTHIFDYSGLDDSGTECVKLLCGYFWPKNPFLVLFEGSIHSQRRVCKKCMKMFRAGRKFDSFFS